MPKLDTAAVRDLIIRDDYAWLEGYLAGDTTTTAAHLVESIVNTPDESIDEGLRLWHYPFDVPVLDNLLDSSGLLDLAIELVGTQDLLLNNCMLWVRDAAEAAKQDTRYHRDYADNALVCADAVRDAVGFIIYLTDIGPADGPTRYIPRDRVAADTLWPRHLEDRDTGALDGRSVPLVGPAGSVLVQTLLGLHRASVPERPGRRITLHAVVRRADAHWMSWSSWSRLADGERFRKALPNLSSRSRALLGWPNPEWPGWSDPISRQIVAERFPGIL